MLSANNLMMLTQKSNKNIVSKSAGALFPSTLTCYGAGIHKHLVETSCNLHIGIADNFLFLMVYHIMGLAFHGRA